MAPEDTTEAQRPRLLLAKSRQRAAAPKRGTRGRPTATAATAKAKARRKPNGGEASFQKLLEHPAVRRAALPVRQTVELATLVDAAPTGDDWLHEIKFDGYRMLCRIDKGKARFISRNGHDWTEKLPELAEAAGGLAVKQAILDGEVVSLEPDGTSSFQALQNAFQAGRTSELVYYVFDILHIDGHDVTALRWRCAKRF